MILQLLISGLMSWAGWSWFTPFTPAWALAELPMAVTLAGWLLRDPEAVVYRLQAAAHVAAQLRPHPDGTPRRRPARRGVAAYPVPVRHADFLPAGVTSLDSWRRRRDEPVRRAA